MIYKGAIWLSGEPSPVICHTMNTLKLYLVFLFSSRTLSCLVHLCVSRMLSWFSSPSHNFWASLKPMKELAGGYKPALHLRHLGISYSQGSPHSSFSNALKLNHVLFSASLVVSSSFFLIGQKKATCVHHNLALLCNIKSLVLKWSGFDRYCILFSLLKWLFISLVRRLNIDNTFSAIF